MKVEFFVAKNTRTHLIFWKIPQTLMPMKGGWRMKKYLILAIATITAFAVLFGVRNQLEPQAVAVKLVSVHASQVRKTIECNGKVQATDSKEVFVSAPCIAGEVYVKKGQRVEKGEVLFAVDTDATQQVLSQLSGTVTDIPMDSSKSVVTAPMAGVVSTLNVQTGELTDKSEPCAVITGGEGIRVAVSIREKYLSQVEVGQAVEIAGVAFDKKVYHGTVTHIDETAHQAYVGTVSETVVDAVVSLNEAEADDSLRAGLNARATVVTAVLDNALLVPYECVTQDENGKEYVYVYGEDGTATRCMPQFGEECSDGVLVVSGLSSGVRLVQNPDALSGETVAVQVD